jgi:hypothetical protein
VTGHCGRDGRENVFFFVLNQEMTTHQNKFVSAYAILLFLTVLTVVPVRGVLYEVGIVESEVVAHWRQGPWSISGINVVNRPDPNTVSYMFGVVFILFFFCFGLPQNKQLNRHRPHDFFLYLRCEL